MDKTNFCLSLIFSPQISPGQYANVRLPHDLLAVLVPLVLGLELIAQLDSLLDSILKLHPRVAVPVQEARKLAHDSVVVLLMCWAVYQN